MMERIKKSNNSFKVVGFLIVCGVVIHIFASDHIVEVVQRLLFW